MFFERDTKNKFMKGVMISGLLLVNVFCQAQSNTKEISQGLNSPESAAARCKYLYISNMGSKVDPTAKDGDGYISRVSRKDGKVIDEKFITGLNSPKGLKVIGGKLVVADVDRVVAYRLKTGKKIWEADLTKAGIGYANDISIRNCGSIYVSATDKNAVYKVCRSGKVKQLKVKGDIEGANGLYHSALRLYISNYGHRSEPSGSFGVINLCSKKYKPLGNGGVYDGMQKVCGRIVVSDWVDRGEIKGKGRLLVYNPCKKTSTEIKVGTPLSGPSDIYADKKMKILWIPCMLDNKLVGVPFKALMVKKQ